jgi:hypothetical protein
MKTEDLIALQLPAAYDPIRLKRSIIMVTCMERSHTRLLATPLLRRKMIKMREAAKAVALQ